MPYLNSPSNELQPQLSPDGKWIAYVSDESNEFEIYVESFPERGSKNRISTAGGLGPTWGRAGRELYYVSGDGMLLAATVSLGASGLEVTDRRSLFQAPRLRLPVGPHHYQVLDDGERFVFNELTETRTRSVTVIKNWMSLVEQ